MNWLDGSSETYDQFLSRLTRECNNACTLLHLFPEARVMRKTVFNVRNLIGTFASGSNGALVQEGDPSLNYLKRKRENLWMSFTEGVSEATLVFLHHLWKTPLLAE
jgi:hypothetical protein